MGGATNKVTIQQPPIKELGKKRSCIKRTCTTGCFFILLFIVGIFLLVKFVSAPRSKQMKNIPEIIKTSTVLYDAENIDELRYIPGRNQHSLIETIALLPKVLLSPVVLNLDKKVNSDNTNWQAFARYIKEPITDTRDSYELYWSELPATQRFVFDYYEQGLLQTGYSVEVSTDRKSIRFSKEHISGTIRVEGDETQQASTMVTLRLFLPSATQ